MAYMSAAASIAQESRHPRFVRGLPNLIANGPRFWAPVTKDRPKNEPHQPER